MNQLQSNGGQAFARPLHMGESGGAQPKEVGL